MIDNELPNGRVNFTEEQLAEALKTCASEPIHIPGSIQPHGALLIVKRGDHRVIGSSANAGNILGVNMQQLPELRLNNILSIKDVLQLDKVLVTEKSSKTHTLRVSIGGKEFDLTAHLADEDIILEFEVAEELENTPNNDFYYVELNNFSKELRGAKTFDDLFNSLVNHIRFVTGFDRVKFYRFDPEWNGQVVAESLAEGVPSYKGLHFPASDIPEQARILYAKNYIRTISDIEYIASPILRFDGSNKPVDLSFSVLRSVSPVHIQYLRNMGVQASMSVSIMQDDKLWGLVACHHLSPLFLSQRIRTIAELMGHMFSSLLSSFNKVEDTEEEANRKLLLERLAVLLDKSSMEEGVIESNATALMEALDAQCLFYRTNGINKQFGACPEEASVDILFNYLFKEKNNNIFYTDNVEEIPGLQGCGIKGGILAMPLNKDEDEYIAWYRDPQIIGVNWAGKPEKNVTETVGGYRLTPRSSFSLWQDTVKNRSNAWSKAEVDTAQSIARLVLEHEKNLARLQNKYKTEFLSGMSHELKSPMDIILSVSKILAKNSNMDKFSRKLVDTLYANSEHLLDLINDLLDISKVESKQAKVASIPFNLAHALQNTIIRLQSAATEKNLLLDVKLPPENTLNFFGDPVKIKQILSNTIKNIIHYTTQGIITIDVTVAVADNLNKTNIVFEIGATGISITDDEVAKLFSKYPQGTAGLGLTISRQLVELLGGTIQVHNPAGELPRFTVVIPVSKNEISLPGGNKLS